MARTGGVSMALFNRRPRQADDTEASRRYLSVAPRVAFGGDNRAIPRTDNLAMACIQRIGDESVSDGARFGEPLTVATLRPCNAIVRDVMTQDRDLAVWIARKIAMILRTVLATGMTGAMDERFDRAFGSVGLAIRGEVVLVGHRTDQLSDIDRDGAKALGVASLALLKVVSVDSYSWTPQDRRFYEDLYTGADGSDVEGFAYDLIAWTAVVMGRLHHACNIDTPVFSYFDPALGEVPRLSEPAWYPNPPKFGDTSTGDAQFQRYWDGSRWTARVRVRQGRGWTDGEMSLHAIPSD